VIFSFESCTCPIELTNLLVDAERKQQACLLLCQSQLLETLSVGTQLTTPGSCLFLTPIEKPRLLARTVARPSHCLAQKSDSSVTVYPYKTPRLDKQHCCCFVLSSQWRASCGRVRLLFLSIARLEVLHCMQRICSTSSSDANAVICVSC